MYSRGSRGTFTFSLWFDREIILNRNIVRIFFTEHRQSGHEVFHLRCELKFYVIPTCLKKVHGLTRRQISSVCYASMLLLRFGGHVRRP